MKLTKGKHSHHHSLIDNPEKEDRIQRKVRYASVCLNGVGSKYDKETKSIGFINNLTQCTFSGNDDIDYAKTMIEIDKCYLKYIRLLYLFNQSHLQFLNDSIKHPHEVSLLKKTPPINSSSLYDTEFSKRSHIIKSKFNEINQYMKQISHYIEELTTQATSRKFTNNNNNNNNNTSNQDFSNKYYTTAKKSRNNPSRFSTDFKTSYYNKTRDSLIFSVNI